MLTEYNEEQKLLQDSALQWLSAHHAFAPLAHGGSTSPREGTWQAFAELGWLGLPVGEAHGGSGLGPLEAGLLCEALGRHLVTEPYAFDLVTLNQLLQHFGDPAQQHQWLQALSTASAKLVLAHHEPGDPSPWSPRRALLTRGDGQWRLTGGKTAFTMAGDVSHWVVSARDADGRNLLVLMPVAGPGLSCQERPALDGTRSVDLLAQDLLVPDDQVLLPGDGDGAAGLAQGIAHGLIALCWQATGTLEALIEQTREHTRQRRQFGQALSTFQVVQHRLAEMKVHGVEARACCELTSLRLSQQDEDAASLARLAVLKVAKAADYVAKQAIQLHGAMGVCEELPVAASFRWLLGFRARSGASSTAGGDFAQALLGQQRFRHSAVLGAAA